MKKYLLLFLLPLLAAPAGAEELKTLHQKTLYAIGLGLGQNLSDYNLKPNEIEYVTLGLEDAVRGKSKVKLSDLRGRVALFKRERRDAKYKTFLEKAAKEKGAKRFPSGLIYKETKKGNGPTPKATDKVRAHYHGTLINGKVFDSSVDRGQPFVAPLNRVISCWTEGMQLMKVGGKARLICPAEIAYGNKKTGAIPAGSTLIFDVELLAINP